MHACHQQAGCPSVAVVGSHDQPSCADRKQIRLLQTCAAAALCEQSVGMKNNQVRWEAVS